MPFTPKKIESIEDYEAMGPGTVFAAMKVKVEAVDDASMTISMPVTDKVKQPFGLLHGGITMFLMESASSMHACWGVDLTKRVPVGTEINGSHLRPVTDGTIRAVAKVVRRSRTFVVHTIDVIHVESGKLVSTGRMTNFYIRTGAESA